MSRYSRYGVVLAAVAPTAEILLVLFASPIASADGVCEKGYRDTTTAERSTMTNVLESVKAALPQAPDGWVIGGYEEISVPGSTCSDSDDTPWSYSFSRTYNRVDDAAERDQAMAEAGAALQADMAAKQPRIDALMAKGQELSVALGEAAQTGDQARIDALNRELQEVQAELESVFNDSSMQSQQDAIGAITMQDRTMDIAVQFNASSSASGDMQTAEVPRGARFAFRGQSTDEVSPTVVRSCCSATGKRAKEAFWSHPNAAACPLRRHMQSSDGDRRPGAARYPARCDQFRSHGRAR